jgi:hypothetical protein
LPGRPLRSGVGTGLTAHSTIQSVFFDPPPGTQGFAGAEAMHRPVGVGVTVGVSVRVAVRVVVAVGVRVGVIVAVREGVRVTVNVGVRVTVRVGVSVALGVTVHTLPVQPVSGSHVWHASQLSGLAPMQTPPWQVSVCVQTLPSSHGVESGWNEFGGQSLDTPSQLSATSHASAAARQVAVLFRSSGQPAIEPLQFSGRSHAPAAGRQTVEGGWKSSVGQVGLEPVQFSATSHAPAALRHTVDAGKKSSAGHDPLDPLQASATSQLPALLRHTVPEGLNVQVAVQQEPLVPLAAPSSHCSLYPDPAGASIVPLPHSEVSVALTKWPSVLMSRLLGPG